MFERFSDEARRTVVRASVEARRLGHDYVGTEHALVALVPARGAAANALASEGVTLDRARLAVADVVGRGRGVSPWDDGPYTARARHAFELCKREAYEFGHRYIASGHLLLALLQIGDANAVRVLAHLGVDLETLRQKVEDSIGTERPPVAPTERRTLLGHGPTIAGIPDNGSYDSGTDTGAGAGEGDAYDAYDEDDVIIVPPTPAPPSSSEAPGATAAAPFAASVPAQDASSAVQPVPEPLAFERRCSFCTRPVDDRDSYVAGAEALICAECVRAAVRLIGDDEPGPAVEGPVPDHDAVAAVTRAFTTVLDPAAPEAERAALLEDGDLLAPLLGWAVERYPAADGARVDQIRFLGTDRALVRYSVVLGATQLPQSGWARRGPAADAPWQVSRTTYTTLLQQAGIPAP